MIQKDIIEQLLGITILVKKQKYLKTNLDKQEKQLQMKLPINAIETSNARISETISVYKQNKCLEYKATTGYC